MLQALLTESWHTGWGGTAASPLPPRKASGPVTYSKKPQAMNKSTYLIWNIQDNLLKSISSKI